MLRLKSKTLLICWLIGGNLWAKDFPPHKVVTHFAFGSCQKVEKGLGIYRVIAKARPQIMFLLGDNIYAHTIEEKAQKYKLLANDKDFKWFRSRFPIYAVWDDHDYGRSDEGGQYPFRKESEKLFKDFFEFPENSEARKREGIYNSFIFGSKDKKVQFILLDGRSFRSELKISPTPLPLGLYVPNDDKTTTILGQAQWQWLEKELKKPAQLRFVLTSFQFLAKDHHFESWMNFPHERERFINLIKSTQANGVVFLSGDRHIAMILNEKLKRPYDLWELTSSGLTEALPSTAPVEAERNLVGEPYFGPNFGWVRIDWVKQKLSLQIRNLKGQIVREQLIRFKSLQMTPEI